MTSSQSDKDNALPVEHADIKVPGETAANASTIYQTMAHSTGILFQNAAGAQHGQLAAAAANQGLMQIYSTTYGSPAAVTSFYLVSLNTRQAVELASCNESGLRASQEPKALSLFCHAHATEIVEKMNEQELASHHPGHGAFTKWTDEEADDQYKALTGIAPPKYA